MPKHCPSCGAVHVPIKRKHIVRHKRFNRKWAMYGLHMCIIGSIIGQLSVLVAYALGHALAGAGVVL